ncbi:MAG: hypothetical protein QXN00_02540 [Candidatus Aenigmatarchaeota archaeon]
MNFAKKYRKDLTTFSLSGYILIICGKESIIMKDLKEKLNKIENRSGALNSNGEILIIFLGLFFNFHKFGKTLTKIILSEKRFEKENILFKIIYFSPLFSYL